MLNPHGKAQLSRALWIGLALYALAVALTWATDEADASWGQRAARLGALGPLLAALATWGSGQLARTRGEARALLALGATPAALERGAVLGGWLLALGGLVIALGPDGVEGQNILPGGQSGNPDSEFFCDQSRKWLANETVPMRYTPAEVVAGAVGRERYAPGF